jgi:hypothetical protein
MIATRDEEIRRRDVIISQLTSRIPEIEPPREQTPAQEVPGAAETAGEGSERAAPRPAAGSTQDGAERPWWRRVFGG